MLNEIEVIEKLSGKHKFELKSGIDGFYELYLNGMPVFGVHDDDLPPNAPHDIRVRHAAMLFETMVTDLTPAEFVAWVLDYYNTPGM